MKNYCKFGNKNCVTAKRLLVLKSKLSLSEDDKFMLRICKIICDGCNGQLIKVKDKNKYRGDDGR